VHSRIMIKDSAQEEELITNTAKMQSRLKCRKTSPLASQVCSQLRFSFVDLELPRQHEHFE
jgi:hypothetical protein